MSREIKFRFWNGKKFLSRDTFCLFPDEYGGFEARELGEYGTLSDLNGTLQQFTGLLDSEGKEIYEGDLIEMPNTLIYQVCFGEWEHTDLLYTKLHGWHLNHQGWTWELSNQGKIIGNIFETSNLLSLCSKN